MSCTEKPAPSASLVLRSSSQWRRDNLDRFKLPTRGHTDMKFLTSAKRPLYASVSCKFFGSFLTCGSTSQGRTRYTSTCVWYWTMSKVAKLLTSRGCTSPTLDMRSDAVSSNPSGMRSFHTIALENSIVSIHVRASCHSSVKDSKRSPACSQEIHDHRLTISLIMIDQPRLPPS